MTDRDSGAVSIESFAAAHVPVAAALFARQYRLQRARRPDLPPRYEEPGEVEERLAGWQAYAPGVVALEAGELAGYLIGLTIPKLKGTCSGVYCPIWAHAAGATGRAATYAALYGAAAAHWVEAGYAAHAITLYAGDREGLDSWFWDGFGMVVVDALRPLLPLSGALPAGLAIRRAEPADVPRLLPLVVSLGDHARRAPIFLAYAGPETEAEVSAWLLAPRHGLWLAEAGDDLAGFMQCEPPMPDVALVVRDAATIGITGAYVAPAWRGRGVGSALLAHLTAWAAASGFERCSVDFESQNRQARRFWLRHFGPVCYSLLRRVDERALPAGAPY